MPFALLLIIGAWLYGDKEADSALTQVRDRDEAGVRVGAAALFGKLESFSSDLVFLASHSTTSVAVNRPSPENIAALADDFMTFSASKSIYDQIRWIDETGMERVRVDFRQGSPVLIANGQLQDKSKRYFFIETIKLKPGEVFVSPLDLNIEQDRIETPFKPMLRIATPVADQHGQNRGIVILNYLGSDLLQAFTKATGQTDTHNMLINSDGYWLKSGNFADEWGFMLNRPDLNLAARSPAAWRRIGKTDQGQLELDDGLWTWKTIYPLNHIRKAETSLAGASDHYFWKVVSHDAADALNTIRLLIWLKVAGIFSLFLGVYGLGSWKLANMWSSQAALKVKYRTVADFAYDWETWTNPAGRYLYCSPSCARITGHSAQAFLANPRLLAEIVHPDDLAKVEAHLQSHEDVGNVCQLAFRIVRSDGEIRWLEHACQPVFDNEGAYLGRRASNRDITERKQIEARLRVAKDSLNDAQRIAHIGSWTLNRSNNELIWSDEVFRLFEIDPNRFAATYQTFLDAIHPADRDAVNRAYAESPTHQAPDEITYRLLMNDGRIKWMHERFTTDFDAAGKPLRSQGTVQDITERMQIEEKRLALEAAHRNVLVREVHHRIKNNLQGITGILRQFAVKNPETQEVINEAISQVQSIAIIHGIQGRASLSTIRPCELTMAIASGIDALWHKAISVDIPSGCKGCIISEAEAVPLALTLNELISNAVKHSQGNEAVRIMLRNKMHSEAIELIIRNQGQLPIDFDFEQLKTNSTGLKLVASLLPHRGARLSWQQQKNTVITLLELEPPVILTGNKHKYP